MCSPRKGENEPADLRREARLLEQRNGIKERRLIRGDGNGGVIIDKGTGVSVAVVLALLGAVFGFFGAWAVPGIRTQQEIAIHIAQDRRQTEDHEQRLRSLEVFASRGDRWSREDHYNYAGAHAQTHAAEMERIREELTVIRMQYAKIDARLQTIESKVN